jgi:hypothetical protein
VPKSRGRPKGRGKPKNRRHGPVRELSVLERIQRSTASLDDRNVLYAERWASGWLGEAWVDASMGERQPEHRLCAEVAAHVSAQPSSAGLKAVTALRRVAPESSHALLDEAASAWAQSCPSPAWGSAPPFEPTRGWRGVNVWDSERVLFVEYQSDDPTLRHMLMAHITEDGGTLVESIDLLAPDAADQWAVLQTEPGVVPMPLVEMPVAEVLADLGHSLRRTDMVWPRHDAVDFAEMRALTWARCRAYLPDWPEVEELTDDERDALVEEFVAEQGLVDDNRDVTRSLADLFLMHGDGYLYGRPFGWSPQAVELFLGDWLPRKATLDAAERSALPEALRRWLRFALNRRGVAPEWINPVVAAVDEFLPEFTEAFDDEASWGPAKQVAAQLAARGIDLTDQAVVEDAMRALNAERLARHLAES